MRGKEEDGEKKQTCSKGKGERGRNGIQCQMFSNLSSELRLHKVCNPGLTAGGLVPTSRDQETPRDQHSQAWVSSHPGEGTIWRNLMPEELKDASSKSHKNKSTSPYLAKA